MSAINLVNLCINYVNFRLCFSDLVFYMYGTAQLVTSIFLSKKFFHKFSGIYKFWESYNDKSFQLRIGITNKNIVSQEEFGDSEKQTDNFDENLSETSDRAIVQNVDNSSQTNIYFDSENHVKKFDFATQTPSIANGSFETLGRTIVQNVDFSCQTNVVFDSDMHVEKVDFALQTSFEENAS